MDPKKPSSESPEDRVDALVRRRERERLRQTDEQSSAATADDRSAQASAEAGAKDPERRPQLTEEQRIEARRRRAEQRGRRRKGSARGARGSSSKGSSGDAPAGGNPLSRGVRATGSEIRRTAVFLAGALIAGLDQFGPVGRVFRSGLAELVRNLGRGLVVLRRAVSIGLVRLGQVVLATDRAVTPRSATIAVAVIGVIALLVSQFLDFRAAEIGQSGYQAVQELTSAPRRDLMTPIDAHSVLLIAVGLVALAGVIAATVTGRRLFGLVIVGAGVVVILVAIVVDLPKGLDVAEVEISYTGVAAVLLTGFWLQLAAGATLVGTGLGLTATSGRSDRNPARPPRPERHGEDSDEGSGRRSPRESRGSVDRHKSTAGSPA